VPDTDRTNIVYNTVFLTKLVVGVKENYRNERFDPWLYMNKNDIINTNEISISYPTRHQSRSGRL
jgi:hypothetical protein